MVYQVLARKWRPRDFTEVASQPATVTVLQNSLDSQKLHHAYLFTGTRGVGKTTLARIFAKSLICEQGISSKPCNTCDLCQMVTAGNCIDVIEIDAASRTKVEDTKAVLDNLAYAPNIARFKIYIIDEVHMLSNHSFNALLKSLEEPPSHVKFLLATTDPQKLPITVLSRCLQFKLKMFTPQAIAAQLEKILLIEHKTFEQSALLQLAIAARGSMRDALSLLEQVLAYSEHVEKITQSNVCNVLGIPDSIRLINLLTAIIKSDVDNTIKIVNNFFENNFEIATVLQEIQLMLKNIAILQLLPNNNLLDEMFNRELLLELANMASIEEIQLYYDIAVNGFKDLAFLPDLKIGFEMIILRMVGFKATKVSVEDQIMPIDKVDIVDKIEKIEIEKNPAETTSEPISENLDFIQIINKLEISAMAKELAEESVFEYMDANKIKLIIDKSKKLLNTPRGKKNLQIALNKYFNRNMQIKEEFQDFEKNPALIQKTVKWHNNNIKQEFINNDNTLQQLIKNVNGELTEIIT